MVGTALSRLELLLVSISWTSFSCRVTRSLPVVSGAISRDVDAYLLANALLQVAH